MLSHQNCLTSTPKAYSESRQTDIYWCKYLWRDIYIFAHDAALLACSKGKLQEIVTLEHNRSLEFGKEVRSTCVLCDCEGERTVRRGNKKPRSLGATRQKHRPHMEVGKDAVEEVKLAMTPYIPSQSPQCFPRSTSVL